MRSSSSIVARLLVAIACSPFQQAVNAKATICDSECQKGCDAACQAAIQGAFQAESSSWVSDDVAADPFYETPFYAGSASPGDVLRWEDVPQEMLAGEWTIPGGLSFSRFLYMTEDVDGKPIPASAWLLLPYSASSLRKKDGGSTQGLDVVVWTHGTAGLGRNCATTNHKSLYYDWSGPFFLAEMGYAVVAPDYSGQGSEIPQGFMYMATFLHAADVAYSLIAAKKVVNTPGKEILGSKWLVMGHSEGGGTAWRTNERMGMPESEAMLAGAGKLVGAVALAPALRPRKLIPDSMKRAGTGPAHDPFSVYFLQTMSRLFPDKLKVTDFLGDVPQQRLGVLDASCYVTGDAAVGGFTPQQLFKNLSWLEGAVAEDWDKRYNNPGPHSLAAPMLLIQGVADTITPAPITMDDFDQTCVAYPQSSFRARLYPGTDHGTVMHAARQDIMAWIAERFSGTAPPPPPGCVREDIAPLTDRYGRSDISWTGVPRQG